jgi:uncharacterized protein
MKIFKLMLNIIRFICIIPIIIYQKLISPMLPPSCIYYPSCSHYSKNSIINHGVLKGIILSVSRIFRCTGVLFSGGEDPVPENFTFGYVSGSYKQFWKLKK